MILQMTTPALIFPAISLIMLAYTNRFLGLSSVIRSLTHEYQQHPDDALLLQIDNLQRRVIMFSIASIWALSVDNQFWGICLFIACLVCMAVSLLISMYELFLSCHALEIALAEMENDLKQISHPILARPRRKTKRETAQQERKEVRELEDNIK